jgi:hypothetical protein
MSKGSQRNLRPVQTNQYAVNASIDKRVYPHLFRHQIITFLTRKGIISPKLQLLSGHAEEKSLAIYRDLALADVSPEYQEAMRAFPVRLRGIYCVPPQLPVCYPLKGLAVLTGREFTPISAAGMAQPLICPLPGALVGWRPGWH